MLLVVGAVEQLLLEAPLVGAVLEDFVPEQDLLLAAEVLTQLQLVQVVLVALVDQIQYLALLHQMAVAEVLDTTLMQQAPAVLAVEALEVTR